MADESSKDDSTVTNDDDRPSASEGRSRSKWLDSLIERLDEQDGDEEDGTGTGLAAAAAASQSDAESAPAPMPPGESPELAALEALDAADEEDELDAAPPEAAEVPEIEDLAPPGEPLPEDIPEIDALMPDDDGFGSAEAGTADADDVMMLRSGEYAAMEDVAPPPPKGPPPPPPPTKPVQPGGEEEEEEALSFEVGDEMAADAPYGVSEQGEELRAADAAAEGDEEGEDVDVDLEEPEETGSADVDVDVSVDGEDSEEPADVDEEGPTIVREGSAQPDVLAGLPPVDDEPEPVEDEQPPALDLALQLAAEQDPVRLETMLLRELEATDEDARKALLHHELGHLFQTALDDESRAAKAYAQALNLDPLLRPNVWAIARVFTRRELWPNLVKLYDAQARLEQNEQRRAEILLEKGWVLQDHMTDPAGARKSFWAAYDASGESWLLPLLALEKLDRTQGDVEDLAQVLRHMAETAVDPGRRAAVLVELAQLQDQLEGGTPQVALLLLERAGQELESPRQPLEIAEGICREAGLHRELTDNLRRQAEVLAQGDPPDLLAAAAKLRDAAQIARWQLEDADLARELLEGALEHAPDEMLLQRDLIALAEAQEDWERARELLLRQMSSTTDEQQRARLAFRAGLAGLLAGASDANESFEEALKATPGYLPVLAEKERHALSNGDLGELAELYVAEADAVEHRSAGLPVGEDGDPPWAADALWRAAALFNRYLDGADRAVALSERALTVLPGFKPAVDELEQLYLAAGRHEELADLLEREAEATGIDDEQAAQMLESLAALCHGVLAQPERELKVLQRLRERSPDGAGVQRRIVEVLERLGRHDQIDEALRELEEQTTDDTVQLHWKLRRAHVNELQREGGAEVALDIYREILEKLPTQPHAFTAAENLLRRLEKHEDLARLLRRAADDTLDQERKCEILVRLASVFRRQLDKPAEAASVFGEVLAIRPEDPVVLRTMVRSSLDAGDHARVAEGLERLVEQEQEPTTRVRHMVRLAEVLADCQEEAGRSEELLNRVVEESAGPAQAVDTIEELTRRQVARGDYAEAIEGLRTLTREGPEDARGVVLEEQAWITGGPLGDVQAAGELWDEVLAVNSRNPRGLWGRVRVAAQQRNPGRLSRALAGLAEIASDESLEASLMLRAGLLADATGDPDDAALGHYRRALEQMPDNVEALVAALAKPGLEPAERAGLTDRLSGLATDRVREDMRLELAEIFEAAGQGRRAGEELAEVLRKTPDSLPALIVLQRLVQAAGDRELEVRVWANMATLLTDQSAKAEAYNRAGEILEELEQIDNAAIMYRQVLALLPHDANAFDRLHRLYTGIKSLQGLEDLLGHRIAHTEPDKRGDLIALHFERAEIRLQRKDTAGAARDMGQILRYDPRHLEALRQLAGLYDQDNNPRRALELYTRYVEAADSRSLKRPAVLRVAELLHQLGRTADAIDAARQFLELAPDDPGPLELLADLYVKVRDFTRAIDVLERMGELSQERDTKAEILRRVAGLHWKDMKNLQEARATLLRARDVDPANIEIVDDLRQLSQQMGLQEDTDRLLGRAKDDLLERLTTAPFDPELYRKLMRVAEWHEDTFTLVAAMGARCFLGTADAQDRELYGRHAARLSFEPKRQGAGQSRRGALIARGARSAFGEIWAVIAEAVSRLNEGKGVATDPSAYNVGRGDKVDRRAGGPVSKKLDPIAAVFGLGDFDIYMSSSTGDLIAGVVSDPPALVVGHQVVTSLDARARFLIGRTMSLLRDRAFVLETIDRDELERMLCGAVHLVEPGASLTLPRGEIEEAARKLQKAMSRKARRALPLAVNRFMQEGGDLADWLDGVLATANRSGLLACGDIMVAMDELVPALAGSRRDSMTTAEIVRTVKEDAHAGRLLVYSVSSDYLDLRRELQV